MKEVFKLLFVKTGFFFSEASSLKVFTSVNRRKNAKTLSQAIINLVCCITMPQKCYSLCCNWKQKSMVMTAGAEKCAGWDAGWLTCVVTTTSSVPPVSNYTLATQDIKYFIFTFCASKQASSLVLCKKYG